MKRIITHVNPDLDAIASAWLIQKFLPGWEEAEISFCQAETTFDNKLVDSDPDILHVDVGLGKLDHHQTNSFTCASKLSLDFILEKRKGQELSSLNSEALKMIVKTVNEIDNAHDSSWSEVKEERYDFYLHSILSGLRRMGKTDIEVVQYGFLGLNAILKNLKAGIKAKEEIKKGIEFQTPWGKAIALETGNELFLWESEKAGYILAAKKDPDEGNVRIYARYDSDVDLKKAYQKLKEMDKESDWFLHSSSKLLLNGSRVKDMRPTKLSLEEVIEVLKNG